MLESAKIARSGLMLIGMEGFFNPKISERRFMLWLSKRSAPKDSVDVLYAEIMAAALNRNFFERHGLEDSFRIRFESACLHLCLVLRRLRVFSSAGQEASQHLVDRFFDALDHAMRESGVGDVAVPKRMEKFVRAFRARARAYDGVFEDEAKKTALEHFLASCFFDGAEITAGFASEIWTLSSQVQSLSFDALLCGRDVFDVSAAERRA